MYGRKKWGVNPEKIKLIEYSLLSNQSAEISVTDGEIADTKTYIQGSIANMESLLVDVENNVPKEKRFFKKVEDVRLREGYNFRKVCEAGFSE